MLSALMSHVDVGRAIIALTISITLFIYVRAEANPPEVASFEVPVDLVDIPPGLLVAPGQPPSVRVRVSAPRETLTGIRTSSLRAYIDLRRGRNGIDEYPVGVELPDPRVHLSDVVPSEIPVRLEELIDRRVPVRVNRIGTVPFGYEAGIAEVEPNEITESVRTAGLAQTSNVSVGNDWAGTRLVSPKSAKRIFGS